MQLQWTKGWFSSNYELKQGEQQLGTLQKGFWNGDTTGQLRDQKVKFRKKGFFKSDMEIIDLNEDRVIGEIQFHTWSSKAEIELNGQRYQWEYKNFWNSKWRIRQNQEKMVDYKRSFSKGEINATNDNAKLVLSGLFIANNYLEAAMITSVVVVLIISI